MDILNTPITEMTFADVATFCKLKVIEGVTLEYKSDFPKDLAKQFVTFSNTQGGLVIIGVEEDQKTGLPSKWEGIDDTTKPIDRVYQYAANVVPFPQFEVATTDAVKGKVFVLIRIREGVAPPYSTNSDPTPWVRTGNISTPVRAANREELLQLLGKKERAQGARELRMEFVKNTFSLDLAEAETERKKELDANPNENIYKHTLGVDDNAAVFDIHVMPYYPNRLLLKYSDIIPTHIFLGDAWQNTPFIHGEKTIPGGITAFTWSRWQGTIMNGQIYLDGLSYLAFDVLRSTEQGRFVSVFFISEVIKHEFMIARRIVEKSAYNGQLSIYASLRGGKGAYSQPPTEDLFIHDNLGQIRYDKYEWKAETDTTALADDNELAKVHLELVKQICWDTGLGEIQDSIIMGHFLKRGWYNILNSSGITE